MAPLRITESELARNLHELLGKVRNGIQIVVEENHRAIAIIQPSETRRRTIPDLIEFARARESENGPAVLDPDFAADIAEIIRTRRPWTPSWQD